MTQMRHLGTSAKNHKGTKLISSTANICRWGGGKDTDVINGAEGETGVGEAGKAISIQPGL